MTAVDGQALEYDSSGNPVSYYNGYRYTMSWTEGRKLESITYNNKTSSYEYDHEGLRTKQVLRDGSYIVYEIVDGTYVGETRYNANNTVTLYMRYLLDESGSVVGISLWYPDDTAWTDYYFIKNLQGDVLAVYEAETQTLVASYTYDSWGNILTKSGSLASINPFRYRSYYFDEQMWFYYLQSRYYDPAVGRFINADGLVSTGQGLLSNNMFAYCGNDPIGYFDPLGTIRQTFLGDNHLFSNDILTGIGGGNSGIYISTSREASKDVIEQEIEFIKNGTYDQYFDYVQDTYAMFKFANGIRKVGKGFVIFLLPDPTFLSDAKGAAHVGHGVYLIISALLELFDEQGELE